MSIATRTGDHGTTGLMYNRRVSKCHPRVEAYGTVDELNSALGVARATTPHPYIRETLLPIQRDLVTVMGELATAVDDLPRYAADGYPLVTTEATSKLDAHIRSLEAGQITYKGWATPGATADAAALDVARVTARRAERRVCALQETDALKNPEIIIFLNRLSDLLWLLARWVETRDAGEAPGLLAVQAQPPPTDGADSRPSTA
ncbi:MAG: cob(I)yrinic acid a,c-diamide adenosyltransferase [Limisphaerales bacterium]